MNSHHTDDLRRELLDDYFAECDELLRGAREALDAVEDSPAGAEDDPEKIEAVFRNVHSLKGNSAMVGFGDAEQLAHRMEDVLRRLTQRQLACGAAVIDTLLLGLDRFEQTIAAHRSTGAPADTADVLRLLDELRGRSGGDEAAPIEPGPAPAALPATDPAEAARARGLQPWKCGFSRSVELDRRGVNLAALRERLSLLGEIFSVTPSVRPGGSVTFDFIVGLREAPAELGAWAGDGVSFQPLGEPKAAGPGEAGSLTPSHIVRVDLTRLDDLMRVAGELVIHRSRLEERIRRYDSDPALKEISLALHRSLRELREGISRVRLVPIAEIFAPMPLLVRQLARESSKQAQVKLEGQHTPVDKFLIERLKEPLLHLVRNAFAHGVESREARAAAGKPSAATIRLSAQSAGDSLIVRVADDGAGIDAGEVAARARALGVPVPEPLDASGLLGILCAPGFSTRTEADLSAGRGVGMAVVARAIREIGGTFSLESRRGSGTEFTLRLPLSLSIISAVVVTAGDQVCALPQSAIAEFVEIALGEVRPIQGAQVVAYRGGLLPLVWLRDSFRLPRPPDPSLVVVVMRSERGAAGLVVDRVRTQREVVVRPLLDPLVRARGIAGATELGDGRPVLILDPAGLTGGMVCISA